jgi:hypothetical protein
LEFYLYKDNELVGYSKLFRNGYYEQLEADDEGKEEILHASTTIQQNDWLNPIPSVINNESAVDIQLKALPRGYKYVIDGNVEESIVGTELTLSNNVLKIGVDIIKSTHTIEVIYTNNENISRVLASKTFEVEKSWYIECPDELDVYTVKKSEDEVIMVNPYYYAFPINTNGVLISFPDTVYFDSDTQVIRFDSYIDKLDIYYLDTTKIIKSVKVNKHDVTEYMTTHTGSYYNPRLIDVYISAERPGYAQVDKYDAYRLVPAKTSIKLEPKTY